jgi:hypothetical protein
MTARSLTRWLSLGRARRSAPLHVAQLVALLVCGCSTEKLPPPKPADTNANGETEAETTTKPPGARDAGGSPPKECDVPHVENEADPEPFQELSATVVDEAGDPVADTIVQACGLNVCLQGNTTSQGRAVIKGDEVIEKLAFKYGDGLHYAQVALALTGSATYELGEQRTVAFPEADPDDRFEAGNTLTSSGVELTLADETVTTIDVLSYADESEHLFVAKAFDEGAFPQAAEEQGFVSLWALGPAKTEFCPPPELSLPNLTQLEPADAVDLLLLVTDVSGRYGRYAEWQVVASGTVSDDGDHIVTDAGRGIPELGLIGVRPQK